MDLRVIRYCGCIGAGVLVGLLALAAAAMFAAQCLDCSERF